ncbi:MAG: tetratricopeptide repeat protein, partial [Firmicutes bacterium]|nr:tetratricopeptide repeat protein [Bacillota bacterium]
DPSAILRSQIAQVETQITQYQALLEEDPEDVTALMQLGHAYYDLGQIYSSLNNAEDSQANFAQALEPYGKVLELTPDDVNVRVDRAVAAYLSRNNEVAQEEFEAAIKVDPAHAKARFNYGFFLYSALDKPQEALQQWQEVVELDPADEADVVATARTLIDMVEEELAEQANDGESSPEDDTSAEDTD